MSNTDILITDFVSYLSTDKKVLVNINEDWLESYVVGIDIPENRLKLKIVEHGSENFIWTYLFFQLNKHHPKHYKVKFFPFMIGDTVIKKSRKPFKNGEYSQIIEDLIINDLDPKKRLAAKFSDGSICNLEMLTLED